MISNFLQETTSIYQRLSDVYVIRVTEVKRNSYIDETITRLIDDKKTLSAINLATGVRVDASSNQVFVLVPLEKKVEVGDYLLVRELEEGYALYIQRIYSPILKDLDIVEYLHRFAPHWLKDRISFGEVFNENVFYATHTSKFEEYYSSNKEFLKKRFFDYPALSVYQSFKDLANVDEVFKNILENPEEGKDSRLVFEYSEQPIETDYLSRRTDIDKTSFRGDPLFDYLRPGFSNSLVQIEEKKLSYDSLLKPLKSDTDKYPNPFKLEDLKKFLSFDNLLKDTKLDGPYRWDLHKPLESYEVRIGRNGLTLSKDSHNRGTVFLRTEADQGFYAIYDKEKEFFNLRIRSFSSSLLMEEYKDNYNRIHLNTKLGNFFEIYENDDKSKMFSLIYVSEKINLIKDGSTSDSYSAIYLGKDKESFSRLSFEEEYSSGYLFNLLAKKSGTYTFVNGMSNGSTASMTLKTSKGSTFARQEMLADGGKITVETNGDFRIIVNNSGKITIMAGNNVIGEFDKNSGLITLNASGTIITINSSGVSINKDTSITGTLSVSNNISSSGQIVASQSVQGSKFVGNLTCTGQVIQGVNGSINVVCS